MQLSDQQIDDPLAACDRLQRAYETQQRAIRNIARIFENVSKGRPASEGLEPHDNPANGQ